MAKQLLFSQEARVKILAGIEKLAKAVSVTLGPKGRNVAIEKKFGSPAITKDGVTVAKEIILEDPFENMGAQMVKEVAQKTADIAGDGTTTATVLAEAIYREGLKNVTAGANPMALKRGIDKAVAAVVAKIKEIAQPVNVESMAEVQQIGTISANGDETIGKLIAEAFQKVGKDGVITVEESKTMETELEIVEGMQFNQGYLSPYFCTDGEKMICELRDCYILMVEKSLGSIQQLVKILEQVSQNGRNILIICEGLEGEVLPTLVINKLKGIVNVVVVRAPGYGDRRKENLKDIGILTAGKPVIDELGVKLETLTLADLGKAKKVIVTRENTTIIEGAGTKEEIAARIVQISAHIDASENQYDKEKLMERRAKLSGGVAIIKVGAVTESELKEKKDRVDDALHATRAAVEEGIVPGGGRAFLSCGFDITTLGLEGDEKTGADIIRKAIEAPIRQLAINGGLEGSVIIDTIIRKSEAAPGTGYDFNNDYYIDMISAGIIDPAKVTRTALQNAASIAGLLLTTECLMIEIKSKDPQPAQMMQ